MTLLSICIPASGPHEAMAETVGQMLRNKRTDFEILVSGLAPDGETRLSRLAADLNDPRLRLVEREADETPVTDISQCWNRMVPQARGAWITFINASDFADPDICEVIRATASRVPDADALAWGRTAYIPPARREGREIAKIPTGSRLILPEQKDMMRAQFYWEGASDRPDCHFGVWHGALRRDVLERIREAFSGVYFEQAAPETDNACKTVLLARRMVFWERPLSVRSVAADPEVPAVDEAGVPPGNFPFSAGIGAAARIALTIEAFKRRYGIELDGWEDNFIKACATDCETAASGELFHARKAAYAKAIAAWRGKRALAGFRPEFRRNPKLPRFQGVRDGHLHFDTAMDNTRTAADFYRLIDAMLFPVQLLDDKLA